MANKKELIQSLKTIITESSDEDGWANLGEVGSRLNNRYPDFDTRNYGHSKLRPLILSLHQFEIEARRTSKNQNSHYVVRNKAKQR